ncbi:MAG: hypothetical protein EOM69_01445, partial [Clostridia bacterium]|nr:hypothetical protein [Clostridia bacterium]
MTDQELLQRYIPLVDFIADICGQNYEVLLHDVTGGLVMLTLLEAPLRAIAVGDDFTVTAGCDKRAETCSGKFSNIANFRGFPHIPG